MNIQNITTSDSIRNLSNELIEYNAKVIRGYNRKNSKPKAKRTKQTLFN